ncbi:HlyD family type I secretion periplasmic adaptor subunit [Methylomonas sp. EFPC1]|uniref:HlyD family type I secretion periplasmic adaptor subunit n=1 Tax=Methylomonas sp. EFPC1 TaxID=2812647 RepID=UPI001966D785|nr:HlyD family type I secretion periplasmic adaptor subunit [Methylomonas sp. EFPC1]QSB01417.1 HlyD family type I secretion periplasmic adaptor subunit [Methylomonas sp. EFPC1]QSB02991.1 HlyD family type I secretion periplasmic adaptor subunit [Methylomonas sp. EFPC1]
MLKLQASLELLHRYRQAFRHAWARRAELDSVPRLAHESAFLPAALALQETPVSPAPRLAIWLLISFALLAVLWAGFGRIDIVATAQGKIVPNDRVKTIQPLETATVKAIHVNDGQAVKAGDVLIELDATAADADTASIANDLRTAQLTAARDSAFLQSLQTLQNGKPQKPQLQAPDAMPSEQVQHEQRLLDGEWQELTSKLERLEADKSSRQAALRSVQATVAKLAQSAPIARRLAEDYQQLQAKKFVSSHNYLEREQARIEQEGELATQREKQQELSAAIQEAGKQQSELLAAARRTALDRLHDSEQKIETYTQAGIKARQRGQLLTLTAPVDGIVQQLAIHTVGGVVTPAQPLLIVVPADQAMEIEAFVENKDIGFVNPGQEAEIKIETFPYTKYGTLHGEVTHVSSDAINDDKRGLIYSSRVKLPRTTMAVENKTVNLTPGMAVTVEVKTGQRRVIEYFLSPLIEHVGESLRER